MSWIKIQNSLYLNGRVTLLARKCSVHPRYALGALVAIWSVADQLTEDGFIPGWDMEYVDELAGIRGFGEAMRAIGWLTSTDSGVTLERFTEHNGESAKARAQQARRTAACKQRRKHGQNTPVTVPALPQRSNVVTVTPSPREEERREDLLLLGERDTGGAVASPPPQAASAGDGRREARIQALRAADLIPDWIPDLRDADDLPSSKIYEVAQRVKANKGTTGGIVGRLRDWLKDHRAKPKPAAVPRPEPKPEPAIDQPTPDLSGIQPAELERLADGYRATFSQHRAKPTAEILVLPRFATWVGAQLEKQNA